MWKKDTAEKISTEISISSCARYDVTVRRSSAIRKHGELALIVTPPEEREETLVNPRTVGIGGIQTIGHGCSPSPVVCFFPPYPMTQTVKDNGRHGG